MNDPELNFPLDADPSIPVYVRICRALAWAIESGVLNAGDALPGSRVLAEQFKVSRNTVILALNLLEAQGWVEVHPQRGTFVAPRDRRQAGVDWEQPQVTPLSMGTPTPFNWSVPPDESVRGPLDERVDLRACAPDPRLFPAAELGRYYKRAMERKQGEALWVQDPKGQPDFRKALASWLARRRGLCLGSECLVTTAGLHMTLELLVKATLWNFGVVAMEAPGPPEVRTFLENLRVPILGIPVDAEGLVVDELADHLEAGVPVRLLLLSAACQFPTGVRLSPSRRQRILDLVTRHPLVVAEDDGASVWYRGEPPPLPLAHFDPTGKIVHLGSFGQWLAPGIQTGFIYARSSVANRLAGLKKAGHFNTDQVLESALASLMTREVLQIHMRTARAHYGGRLQQAEEAISAWPGFRVEPRVGGLGLWVTLPADLDARAWQQACAQKNLAVLLGADCGESTVGPQHAYLGLARFDDAELQSILEALRGCLVQAVRPAEPQGTTGRTE